MWFREITAEAFGPFAGERLELAAGMTLVWGPNEAGKSSWHAAAYAALCGMRRAKGAPRRADQDFAARHRPWDQQRWRVQGVVELADGRTLELQQDLARQVDCAVRDALLGSDVSGEVMHDGSPDGATLLGLTRETFLATACVRQADLLRVLGDAAALQEQLQRAAATGSADETAERALARLAAFRRTAIGQDRRGATRPLRRAVESVERARDDLLRARQQHEVYRRLAREHGEARRCAEEAERELQGVLATLADRRLDRVERRLRDVRALAARAPDGPPASAPEVDEVGSAVSAALVAWANRPAPPTPPEGPSAAELEAELAALPPAPEGDTEVASEVAAAREAWQLASERLAWHEETGPGADAGDDAAASLGQPRASGGPGHGWAPGRRSGLAVAALMAATGVALLLVEVTVPGVVLLAAGGLGVGMALRSAAAVPRNESTQHGGDAARQRRHATERSELRAAREAAAQRLRAALDGRGAATDGDLGNAVAAYEAVCRRRAAQAAKAARAEDLRGRLVHRAQLESQGAEQAQRRAEAARELREASRAAGLGDAAESDEPDRLADRLEQWQRERAEARKAATAQRAAWERLQALLDGGTVEELAAQLQRQRDEARRFAAVARVALPADDAAAEEVRREHEDALDSARQAFAAIDGRLADQPGTGTDVAEAEEALARAEAELSRLRGLDATIETTAAFLEAARDRSHRDIAPHLRDAVERRLASVTGGRYDEARVDPASLAVQVRGRNGAWRDAARLSHGTAEQVYLLLRVALAEHLGTTGEPVPLLLDDPTVQADHCRSRAVLDLLHRVADERQVVVFSQAEAVRDWAAERLHGPRDALVELDAAAIPT